LKIEIPEFTIYANSEEQKHEWFIGSTAEIDAEELKAEIDKELGELNDDYKTCRKHNLNAPTIKVLSPDLFYNYLEKIGKSGAQNKFPRVLNNDQAKNWISFLADK